ncbi:response regulator [Natrarchaeobius halalkaliphilus]|uniref:Response regulator n=1 Tax=Natrarchaeobius halalkaliphilus TaxID=1679091 RepID=A0A3N6P1U1_9EURY|nr:response regulator [Natrarchaeobius halalkaliphilus]RQG89075.1 response regulator [Natrarchaeobius halalkaliphilus]
MTETIPNEPIDVLLVEDNPGDARLTKEAFKATDSEIRFHVATDGVEAMKTIHTRQCNGSCTRPDIIFLDLNLPGLDGFDVLETLRTELEYPPPPIIVLSSSKTSEDVTRSYELDANAYVTKPESPDEFNTVAQAIEDFWIDAVRHPPVPS